MGCRMDEVLAVMKTTLISLFLSIRDHGCSDALQMSSKLFEWKLFLSSSTVGFEYSVHHAINKCAAI